MRFRHYYTHPDYGWAVYQVVKVDQNYKFYDCHTPVRAACLRIVWTKYAVSMGNTIRVAYGSEFHRELKPILKEDIPLHVLGMLAED